jgi:hypothetical protein
MIDSAQAELDALRKLVQEALSAAPDASVSEGARELRTRFLEGQWARWEANARQAQQQAKQREGTG